MAYHNKRLPNGRFAPNSTPSYTGAPTPVVRHDLVNHIAIVLDSSASMSGFVPDLVREFNNTLTTIRENANRFGQKTTVSLFSFENGRNFSGYRDVIRVHYVKEDVRNAVNLTKYDLSNLTGSTPLNDAVGKAIDELYLSAELNSTFLVIVLTDGEENSSQRWTHHMLGNKIRELQETDKWTFAFQVPRGKTAMITRNLGIPAGNIREWEQTTVGFQATTQATNVGVTNYMVGSATLGTTSTKSFYTDLAKLTTNQIQNNLQDIQDKVKIYKVEKECEIEPFCQSKTGKQYGKGLAFYQLTKPEKVAAAKSILVMEKGKKAVYGGYDARKVLGIPEGQDLRIKPGNHANYDIFIQSHSTNRKLVRGTQLIYMK